MYVAVGIGPDGEVVVCGAYYAQGKADTAAADLRERGYQAHSLRARHDAADWPGYGQEEQP